jgi:5'-deoxynucleotidase YfbR-like HD superfamily hydrolase
MTDKLHALLDGGFIERYHTRGQRMLTRQSVAEHSWRMAAIARYVWPDCSAALLWAILFHDVSERVTGDLPAPVKRANAVAAAAIHEISEAEEERLDIRFELLAEERRLLAWVDRYEGALHCCDELEMGNRMVLLTMRRYMEYATRPEYSLRDPERLARQGALMQELTDRIEPLVNYLGEPE